MLVPARAVTHTRYCRPFSRSLNVYSRALASLMSWRVIFAPKRRPTCQLVGAGWSESTAPGVQRSVISPPPGPGSAVPNGQFGFPTGVPPGQERCLWPTAPSSCASAGPAPNSMARAAASAEADGRQPPGRAPGPKTERRREEAAGSAAPARRSDIPPPLRTRPMGSAGPGRLSGRRHPSRGREGSARLGSARLGSARLGSARPCFARPGGVVATRLPATAAIAMLPPAPSAAAPTRAPPLARASPPDGAPTVAKIRGAVRQLSVRNWVFFVRFSWLFG